MKPAEKTPPNEYASAPNAGRRKFLRNVLLAGAALAAGCKSENPDSPRRARIYQNREFPLGGSLIFLHCRNENGIQSASFKIFRKGKGHLPDSVSMLVPGSFSVSGFQSPVSRYEIYVERISCLGTQSADILIMKNAAPEENPQQSGGMPAGAPLVCAAIALLGGLISWIKGRIPQPGQEDWRVLGPRHPSQ